MKVCVVPVVVDGGQICSIYKLEIKLYKPKHYPKYTSISLEDWEETLEVVFVRELEDAIENHMLLLSKISGIKNFSSDPSNSSKSLEDVSSNVTQEKNVRIDDDEDDDDGAGDIEEADDLGLDAQKRKQQGRDEIDYEDAAGEDADEGEPSEKFAEEDDNQDRSDSEVIEDDIPQVPDSKTANSSEIEKFSKRSKSKDEKHKMKSSSKRSKLNKKDTDRAVFVEAKGMHFEVHFRFTGEPHILLAQVLLYEPLFMLLWH